MINPIYRIHFQQVGKFSDLVIYSDDVLPYQRVCIDIKYRNSRPQRMVEEIIGVKLLISINMAALESIAVFACGDPVATGGSGK